MCGDVGEGHSGVLTSAPPLPAAACALRRFCLVSTFLPLSRRAAPAHLDIRRSRRVKVRKRIEWLSTRRPTHPKSRPLGRLSPNPPAQPPKIGGVGGVVIDFISTLMRLLGLSLSLLQVGVKGL